jgi:ATP-dependent Zn protease
VHARGKQIPRDDDDAFLKKVSLMTTGFSGAALANLMNEAAILQVCPSTAVSRLQRTIYRTL